MLFLMLLNHRGIMERNQGCYIVRINQRSQETVRAFTQYKSTASPPPPLPVTQAWRLHPSSISQSHCCTGTWSVFTYLLLSALAFALNHFLPGSQQYIVLLFPIV